ncbi:MULTISPECIES: nitroreductase family protein [unclassified Mycolicibacterium]|uniref:nitroreductase family protein n=1 Tax=unclassified Mycolicibacterium TaxID=2636767 RepID=UPI0012DE5F89|nr:MULTISPECIES: nitroreductase family protein [unclassified Mycolicibacterium]MUL85031.1 nitroreductase family protein [Mycolicibacterium sp. CBMA 329]MUL90998.1 nitroreductase family protein [Mycolicibacterium sp. CBMA 331]MUL98331.1 nitroreductase family protein [Mycolicibacterium sp. CBMA 334]MUM29060.1 nitroreductase family protein [Mycolicibacterium sp. CBMA 295]MUM40757.1 nitroreductase family protein [Mycolicibacterium sp. CBMA 247]
MDLYDVMRTTGATRQFTDDPLPDDVLERILDNARFAPSGGNRQGTRVVVIRDRDTRESLADLSVTGARRYIAQQRNGESPWNPVDPMGVSADEVAAVQVPRATQLLDAAVVLVVCVDLGVVAALDQDLDRIGVVSGASVYPFAWNILLAARNEGYGGVLTTMAVAEEPKVKALLGIPGRFAVAAVLPLGKPLRQLTKLKRRPVDEIATRERFDGQAF